MKKEANELFNSEKYEEAIAMYQEVKIRAIQIERFVKKRRILKARTDAEIVQLPAYLQPELKSDEDSETNESLVSVEDFKLSPRPNPLERMGIIILKRISHFKSGHLLTILSLKLIHSFRYQGLSFVPKPN